MKVYINPGHDREYDPGAINPCTGLQECDVAWEIGCRLQNYLQQAGIETKFRQTDNLDGDTEHPDRPVSVVGEANDWEADLFVSIHCNAFNTEAQGTEVECYSFGSEGARLAQCIQDEIVGSLGTIDRGIKERPGLAVLKGTDMPSVLVETAFIDNNEDAFLLSTKQDEFARAIARGITDYIQQTV